MVLGVILFIFIILGYAAIFKAGWQILSKGFDDFFNDTKK